MLHVSSKRISRLLAVTPLALLIGLVLLAVPVSAQTDTTQPSSKPRSQSYPEKAPDDPFKARLIPRNSKIYIAPIQAEDSKKPQAQGFESYIAAALRKKDVPLLIVADKSQADFIIEGSADQKGAGLAKKL